MTLILKLYLDMVKMYLHTKNEVSMSRSSKVIVWTDRNTDTQTDTQTDMTENITYPHTRVVIKMDESEGCLLRLIDSELSRPQFHLPLLMPLFQHICFKFRDSLDSCWFSDGSDNKWCMEPTFLYYIWISCTVQKFFVVMIDNWLKIWTFKSRKVTTNKN